MTCESDGSVSDAAFLPRRAFALLGVNALQRAGTARVTGTLPATVECLDPGH